VEAARECGDAGFDVLIACAFNYDAHATEFSKLDASRAQGAHERDLHMAEDLKNTGKATSSYFWRTRHHAAVRERQQGACEVNGVDVFKPQTGEVVSDGATDRMLVCDTDYNEESFFVRHAYFPAPIIPTALSRLR